MLSRTAQIMMDTLCDPFQLMDQSVAPRYDDCTVLCQLIIPEGDLRDIAASTSFLKLAQQRIPLRQNFGVLAQRLAVVGIGLAQGNIEITAALGGRPLEKR